jgi:hypothetical protein
MVQQELAAAWDRTEAVRRRRPNYDVNPVVRFDVDAAAFMLRKSQDAARELSGKSNSGLTTPLDWRRSVQILELSSCTYK